jgi:hypothetical protein
MPAYSHHHQLPCVIKTVPSITDHGIHTAVARRQTGRDQPITLAIRLCNLFFHHIMSHGALLNYLTYLYSTIY